jgi:hypothetical protein
VVGKAVGQFLENLVRLRSKVVIEGAALPRESHDQELCPRTMIAAASRR